MNVLGAGHDPHVGPERHLRRRLDLGVGDRTDLALVLRDDDVGPQRGEAGDVDLVDAEPFGDETPDVGVDRDARAVDVELRPRHRGQSAHEQGMVALVRDADQRLTGAKRAHDLRGTRQERDDPHGGQRPKCGGGGRSILVPQVEAQRAHTYSNLSPSGSTSNNRFRTGTAT